MEPTKRAARARPPETAAEALERGRSAHARQAWDDAYRALVEADRIAPLGAADLQRLVESATLTGRDAELLAALERLHTLHLDAGQELAAARTAFWLGFRLFSLGEMGRAGGWLSIAERLVERAGGDRAERGWLLLPAAHRRLAGGDAEGALESAASAAATGDRLGDPDLSSYARTVQGRALLRLGRHDSGLAVLDEAMLAATRRELSPLVTGLVYCSVIDCCQRVWAVERAREWTTALAAWCDAQPQLATFTGSCRVHRSEILQLGGAWQEAIDEARRATERFADSPAPEGAAAAAYQQAEIHRLRGETAAAEAEYRRASTLGRDPQPGLALLRLAQGRGEAAAAAIRGVVATQSDALARARFLPAAVEILLAVGDRTGAGEAARELEAIAAEGRNEILGAIAAHARGAVLLADGEARAALEPLRAAYRQWRQVGAPYLAARLRVLIGLAARSLGDAEGAARELEAARDVFRELGAAPDLERLAALAAPAAPGRPHGLTPRELEVLRLLATGRTNRAIAGELSLSEKTVDRHVSNIFNKLDVPTRAAATAFAFRNGLI